MSKLAYRLLEENWRHARLSEDRRIAITSVNVLAASAITIATAFVGAAGRVIPAMLLMIFVGVYGSIGCWRLEERAQFHASRARRLRARLDDVEGPGLTEVLEQSDREHLMRWRRMGRLRLHYALVGINMSISLLGVVLALAALQR